MEPGELGEVQPLPLEGSGGTQNIAPEKPGIGQGEGHARHVGVDAESGQTELILLGVIRTPGHRVDRPLPRHPRLECPANPGFEQQGHLRRRGERIARRGQRGVTGQQLMQIGGATAPVANHHNRIVRQFSLPQAASPQPRLQPSQGLHQQATESHQKAHPPAGEGRATQLQASKQHRRTQEAPSHQAIHQQITPCHGPTNPHTRMTG